MRLAYLAKAVSKRVVKLDSGEDVFEADDMVKWEGGWTLCVEGCVPILVLHTLHPVPSHGQCSGGGVGRYGNAVRRAARLTLALRVRRSETWSEL